MTNDGLSLQAYDPTWPDQFPSMADELRRRFGELVTAKIEHIGGTAIPGMPAKPIIRYVGGDSIVRSG